MANMLEPSDIEWIYYKHLTLTTQSQFATRNEKYGLQHEQITNRDGHGFVGKAKNYYFIDNIEREFTDLQELCDCWNEINNFDDPKNEIVWIKKIVPIRKLKLG
ncbi:MAG: hypothetical protein ACJA2M_000790 [Polaribacter sp.]|jgi:hypothetical protein